MQELTALYYAARGWVCAHPWETLVAIWFVVNVLYAQLPKPKNAFLARVWTAVHTLLFLIVTHKDDKGTFQWPLITQAIVDAKEDAPAKARPAIPAVSDTPEAVTKASEPPEQDSMKE